MYPPSHCGDSYALSDFESVHLKPSKQPAGPEFHDRSNCARKRGLLGVGAAALVGLFCIVGGILIYRSKSTISSGIVVIPQAVATGRAKELLSLGLNLVVTLCTEATGFAHGVALRSALASEKRLHFNTNLRLLSAASGFFNPNGIFYNIIMVILLIVSYASSLLVTLWVYMVSSSGSDDTEYYAVCVSEVPLIVLGVALLSQSVVALVCVRAADIQTWSSSDLDLTAALVHHAQIIPDQGRCMRSVCDSNQHGPVTPSPKQPSAWRAHPSIRKVIWILWALVVACFAWGVFIAHKCHYSISSAVQSWSFWAGPQSGFGFLSVPLARTGGVYWHWALYYVYVAAMQAPLALSLHCSELVVNVIRDELMWRKATSREGTTIPSHPLASVSRSPLKIGLLLAKSLLHWMLGNAIFLVGRAEDELLTDIGMFMWPIQILNYAAAILIVSLFFTTIVSLRPKGPQPAAYGHVQTLANLIDEWSPTMWWGDKDGGLPVRHAGTSDHRLPEVNMNALYG